MNKRTGLLYKIVICLLVLVAVTALSFSFAAYTSFNTAKRVVSTTKSDDVRFSSNYLYLTENNDLIYPSRKITTTDSDGTSRFTLQISNFIHGNPTMFNSNDIVYKLHAKIIILDSEGVDYNNIKINDESFANEIKDIENQELRGGAEETKEYMFSFPESYKSKIRFEISAIPYPTSLSSTSNKILVGNISLSSLVISNGWSGKFIDDKTSKNVKDYDGFNYELSGKGSGTVELRINKKLCLSEWFLRTNCITVRDPEEDCNVYILYVAKDKEDVAEDKEAFQLQLYRNPDNVIGDSETWSNLNSMVYISYTSQDITSCPIERLNND